LLKKDVDARLKAGHDDGFRCRRAESRYIGGNAPPA